jgi:hypothetical protein
VEEHQAENLRVAGSNPVLNIMGMKWRFLSFFKNLWQLSFFKKSTNDSNYFGFFSSKLSK